HGGTEAPKGAYTLELLADDLFFLLKELNIATAHYCGLSMGGMIGQTFALKYPGVFKTLTLADTTSRYPAEAAPVWADRVKTAEANGMEPLAQPTLERWFTEPFRKKNPAAVDAIRKLIVATPVAGYAGCCHALPKINATARLKEIRCPILVIVGGQDPGTPVPWAKETPETRPGSRRVTTPQAAPLANLEQPAAFTAAMETFLA